MRNGRMANRNPKRCDICRRRLTPSALTVVTDDLGEHELCARCEEFYSETTMRHFARELARHGESLALASRAA